MRPASTFLIMQLSNSRGGRRKEGDPSGVYISDPEMKLGFTLHLKCGMIYGNLSQTGETKDDTGYTAASL